MNLPNSSLPGMAARDALQVLVECRRDHHIVITNQGAARIWPRLASHELDFHYNPSTMGGAVSLALGLALARPELQVIVVSGDGALLMNLGSLVSVVAAGADNLTVIVLDNGIYEVTGGQRTPGAEARVDFAAIARGAGLANAQTFHDLVAWRRACPGLLAAPGPRFACLQVAPADPADLAAPSLAIQSQVARLQQRLL
jgi:thiamine pyrophosphate-dependent acetolactate synthase large subunit-like protein